MASETTARLLLASSWWSVGEKGFGGAGGFEMLKRNQAWWKGPLEPS